MHLTGPEAGPPLAPSVPVLTRLASVLCAITDLAARRGARLELPAGQLLAARAALSSHRRRGAISANGTCRLLRTADGWIAVNLARPADLQSLPAALGRDVTGDPFDELSAEAESRSAAPLAARLQLVGIPAAVLGAELGAPVRLSRIGAPGRAPDLVLDLSAMWAGPLCARILHQAGWQVLKVEDPRRPDGARSGPAPFYGGLHDGIPAVRLDLTSAAGRAELLRLADQAGVIVESSRPRALRGLGLVAEDWLRAAPGRVWVSVTGYGRDDPTQRVAFGDDAAVAGGLVAWGADGSPAFCGDAIADPLTGLFAAAAALAAAAAHGGFLVDAAMARVSADLARPSCSPEVPHALRLAGSDWVVSHGAVSEVARRYE
jgi:crotonobetainyl-CoA:carnitine CoA-transferase CaiB-like acyl-CoA transferase